MLSDTAASLLLSGMEADPDHLMDLANARMPVGEHAGELLLDLPEEYIFWFANGALSRGGDMGSVQQTGYYLAVIHELRLKGMDMLLRPLVDRTEASAEHVEDLSGDDELDWLMQMLTD